MIDMALRHCSSQWLLVAMVDYHAVGATDMFENSCCTKLIIHNSTVSARLKTKVPLYVYIFKWFFAGLTLAGIMTAVLAADCVSAVSDRQAPICSKVDATSPFVALTVAFLAAQ